MNKTAKKTLAQFAAELAETRLDILEDDFRDWVEKCGSPIETTMLAALLNANSLLEGCMYAKLGTKEEMLAHRGPEPFIVPQAKITKYRVDFLVTWYRPNVGIFGVVVECDGHDSHEKTKEQARRDKSRDREILYHGWPVLRFTGSEIYNDAMGCADDVGATLFEIWMKKEAIAHGVADEQ